MTLYFKLQLTDAGNTAMRNDWPKWRNLFGITMGTAHTLVSSQSQDTAGRVERKRTYL